MNKFLFSLAVATALMYGANAHAMGRRHARGASPSGEHKVSEPASTTHRASTANMGGTNAGSSSTDMNGNSSNSRSNAGTGTEIGATGNNSGTSATPNNN